MRYKTLFRAWLKVLGVYFTLSSLAALISILVNTVRQLESGSVSIGAQMQSGLPQVFLFLMGIYLFLGGGWIADLAMPSNRPYCHECGYEIGKSASANCPECGVRIIREPAASRSD
jgi:predicted RNA-binding Zn-ribbon protein involved in translation (DUF1610 family)